MKRRREAGVRSVCACLRDTRMPRRSRYADGYMTVFLALILAVLLPMILGLVQAARYNAVLMRTEIAGNTAVRSVLGEFHRELLKQYDLYFVDASYGTGTASLENVRQHLQMYMEKNLAPGEAMRFGRRGDFAASRLEELTVDASRFAADDGAQALREQVYAYMSADPVGNVLSDVLTQTDSWHGLMDDGKVWEESRKKAREDFREGLARAKEEAREEHTREEREEAREEGDDTALEAVGEMESFRLLPILRQVFGDMSRVSGANSGGSVLSQRGIHYGSSLNAANSHGYPRADEALFDLYLGEKCGWFTSPLEKGRLKYQLEYILEGKDTDAENLEKIAEKLVLIREGVNCACLFSDSGRMSQAEMLAAIVSLVLLNPELKDLLKTVLLFSWAYLESIQDLRTLFDGGRVPLWKKPEDWKTSLLGILAPSAAVRGGAKGEGSGLSYGDYLQAFLFMEGSSVKSLRAMDVMEMDIRRTPGNASFRMDWCLDAFSMTARVRGAAGCSCTLRKTEGYD